MSQPTRRDALRGLCYGIAAVPLLQACGNSSTTPPDAPDFLDDAPPGSDWASGGTASMTDKASYPNPFPVAPTTCILLNSTTEGPCTTDTDLAREDISEAWTGLPVRLAFKVVDGACAPLAGVIVKVWHTNHRGSYSGVTPNQTVCVLDQSYATMNFMRGVQTTNAEGVAYFDTCFPGWYAGRAVHIHFQVKMGVTSTIISQLFFPETVTQQIFATHPEYKNFNQPDTTNATDNIISGFAMDERARLIFDVARMTDGAMMASKVVTVV